MDNLLVPNIVIPPSAISPIALRKVYPELLAFRITPLRVSPPTKFERTDGTPGWRAELSLENIWLI